MKRFFIHCSTAWCGMDNTFRAIAEKEEDLWELADQMAYDNFMSYGGFEDILEDLGYDTEDLTVEEMEDILADIDESAYYGATIEECEDDEEWNSYSDYVIGENNE